MRYGNSSTALFAGVLVGAFVSQMAKPLGVFKDTAPADENARKTDAIIAAGIVLALLLFMRVFNVRGFAMGWFAAIVVCWVLSPS